MKKHLTGFSLIELFIIVTIITVLGAIIIPAVSAEQTKNENRQAEQKVNKHFQRRYVTVVDEETAIIYGGINTTNTAKRIVISAGGSPLTIVVQDANGKSSNVENVKTVIIIKKTVNPQQP